MGKQRFLEFCELRDIVYIKQLCQDISTNGILRILCLSVLYYKRDFSHLEVVNSNFIRCQIMDEWAKIEKVLGFLKVFYKVTSAFSGVEAFYF